MTVNCTHVRAKSVCRGGLGEMGEGSGALCDRRRRYPDVGDGEQMANGFITIATFPEKKEVDEEGKARCESAASIYIHI